MNPTKPPAFVRTEPAHSPIHRYATTTPSGQESTRWQARDVAGHIVGPAAAGRTVGLAVVGIGVAVVGQIVRVAIDMSSAKIGSRTPDEQTRGHRSLLRRARSYAPAVLGWRRAGRRGQRGSVTAETAVAFPALVIVLAVALWGVSAAAAQVACVDAARAGARAAARGEPESEVRAAVLRAAPPRAHVSLSHDPLTTRVVVQAVARPPLKGLFPALKLGARAVAATEPEGGRPMP